MNEDAPHERSPRLAFRALQGISSVTRAPLTLTLTLSLEGEGIGVGFQGSRVPGLSAEH
jgi:hypothetical protein